MDIRKCLMIVKGEDKTASVLSWSFDRQKSVYTITYNNQKSYFYRERDVRYWENPDVEMIGDSVVYEKGEALENVSCVCFFGAYCRVFYSSGKNRLVPAADLVVERSALRLPKAKQTFEYLKEIAECIGLTVGTHNILSSRYEKIKFVRNDGVLSAFLNGEIRKAADDHLTTTLYPFGFNLSQKKAVENALRNQLSVIEGPPGTGKTQTILNIIANAVIRGKSVAVVSSNNSATANVFEKLKKYGVDFIAAPLGSNANKELFIETQSPELPDMRAWNDPMRTLSSLRREEEELDRNLMKRNELSLLSASLRALRTEFEHFQEFYKTLPVSKSMPAFPKSLAAEKYLMFAAECEQLQKTHLFSWFFKKVLLKFSYGIKGFRFLNCPKDALISHCQNLYYLRKIEELQKQEEKLNKELERYNLDGMMSRYAFLSMGAFKAHLARRYGGRNQRKQFVADDLWKNPAEFVQEYPVILSTTYSLRASLSDRFVYDYVIVDEASQVDLATGALALSCAKRAVIVGDLKQLPNVVNREQQKVTDSIFEKYDLNAAYRYSDHSMLSSVVELFPQVPRALLREHYRCHPDIIGFCNQRFYNNELIILTKSKSFKEPLVVYQTAPGNHARDHVNQRQIDVITNEVFPQQGLNPSDGSVGIVTPYRNQANALQKTFANTAVKADTADKFQGQERSVMIFSTVDNEIGEFASDPNRLNVAVSRAVDQFIVVTDGNNNDEASPIHDLIGYIRYHNHEIVNSEIHSVFDYLYRQYAQWREKAMRKYGRVSEVESENLMYRVIRDVLEDERFGGLDVVLHVPLRMILSDLRKLNTREVSFATNHLTHVDFLVFSKMTHRPVLVIEVDGFAYHNEPKQQERDRVKNEILGKYNIPMLRLSTVGSGEKEKVVAALAANPNETRERKFHEA
ncbi:MAG: DUF2726 domain-containing protein [Ruminococcaceae bacterium]|nr:DUF2726 domain-containing protein [Oscillospiraceae bacterium]